MDEKTKKMIDNFRRWLQNASDEELGAKRREILAAHRAVYSAEGRTDLNLALRLLDEEVWTRLPQTAAERG